MSEICHGLKEYKEPEQPVLSPEEQSKRLQEIAEERARVKEIQARTGLQDYVGDFSSDDENILIAQQNSDCENFETYDVNFPQEEKKTPNSGNTLKSIWNNFSDFIGMKK